MKNGRIQLNVREDNEAAGEYRSGDVSSTNFKYESMAG